MNNYCVSFVIQTSPLDIIYDAHYAKFLQNEDLKNILLLTRNAKLIETYDLDDILDAQNELMKIREELQDDETSDSDEDD